MSRKSSFKMAGEYEFYVQARMRGYHAYYMNATVYIGEILDCEIEPENGDDKYAVAVKNKDGVLVGHVPIELSKIFTSFCHNMGKLRPSVLAADLILVKAKG